MLVFALGPQGLRVLRGGAEGREHEARQAPETLEALEDPRKRMRKGTHMFGNAHIQTCPGNLETAGPGVLGRSCVLVDPLVCLGAPRGLYTYP